MNENFRKNLAPMPFETWLHCLRKLEHFQLLHPIRCGINLCLETLKNKLYKIKLSRTLLEHLLLESFGFVITFLICFISFVFLVFSFPFWRIPRKNNTNSFIYHLFIFSCEKNDNKEKVAELKLFLCFGKLFIKQWKQATMDLVRDSSNIAVRNLRLIFGFIL